MFGGKTTELAKRLNRLNVLKKYQLFKHSIDNRYSDDVTSHDGLTLPATYANCVSDMENKLGNDAEVIGIDEVQFFESAVIDFCRKYVTTGRIVVAAGLLKDFRNQFFPFRDNKKNMSDLLLVADTIDFYTALCKSRNDEGKDCGREASRIQKYVDGRVAPFDSETVKVGGEGDYAPKCWEHYIIPGK